MGRRKLKECASWVGVIGFLTAMVAWGVYDAHSSFRWVSFWQDAAHKTPHSYRAQLNASRDFYKKGSCAFALAYGQQCLRIDDNRLSGYLNSASAASCLGAYHLAYQYYEKAFDKWPCIEVAQNLMILAQTIGKTDRVKQLKDIIPTLDQHKTVQAYLDDETTDA